MSAEADAVCGSQVNVLASELDEHVESFRTRPLNAGPYPFIAADALVLKVRRGRPVSECPRAARDRRERRRASGDPPPRGHLR